MAQVCRVIPSIHLSSPLLFLDQPFGDADVTERLFKVVFQVLPGLVLLEDEYILIFVRPPSEAPNDTECRRLVIECPPAPEMSAKCANTPSPAISPCAYGGRFLPAYRGIECGPVHNTTNRIYLIVSTWRLFCWFIFVSPSSIFTSKVYHSRRLLFQQRLRRRPSFGWAEEPRAPQGSRGVF